MSLTWTSIGHAFASGFSAIVRGANYLASGIDKVETSAAKVEQLSALIPGYGPQVVQVEQLAYAGLGLVAAGLHYGGAAFEKNLLDNGADQSAIDAIKALIKQFPALIQDVEAAFGKAGTAAAAVKPANITAAAVIAAAGAK